MGSFMPTTERIRLRQSDYQSLALPSDGGIQPVPLWFVAGVHFAGFGLWFCWTLVAVHLHHVGAGLAFMERFSLLAISGLGDRKSTRLNSSHVAISYAVFCLKKKKQRRTTA